jgi:2-oxoisovalerate dehydrogenase E1 component
MLATEFQSFVVEQFPFLSEIALEVWRDAGDEPADAEACLALRTQICDGFAKRIKSVHMGELETLPFVDAKTRHDFEKNRLHQALSGFFERHAIRLALSPSEKRWMLEGMILTRAVDNCLKRLFISGEIQYQGKGFQGKGFRSLGQEAVYAAALKLKRGDQFSRQGKWQGDVIAPLIRDLGILLAFTEDVSLALNAQAGKEGLPLSGKDLHLGDLSRGVLPPAAPLTIATCSVTGVAWAMQLKKQNRVGVSFIGEGGSSLGEWHEAINLAASKRLPMIFCVQNNQTALSTPVAQQSALRCFSVDGTRPEHVAAAFGWAAERARKGMGPVLIELISMRMCGHAHHDDMLYLGKDPELSFDLPGLEPNGYVDAAAYKRWAQRDPVSTYAKELIQAKICSAQDVEAFKRTALSKCEAALEEVKSRPWPKPSSVCHGVFSDQGASRRHSLQELEQGADSSQVVVEIETAPEFSPKGATFLEAIALGVKDALVSRSDTFVIGEDVGPPYGNAFMVFKPLLEKLGHRFFNTPIAEGAIIGACVGMALEGLRPIGEMQFNDFVASGFNQLVNNAAKFCYRTGTPVPMVLRMPWGGLRRAGPYHSQDTSPWFYRTPGLKIVVPSTPHDARALLQSAIEDENPVLFYEHIALYRDPSIKQLLEPHPAQIPIGKAAFRALGTDLSIISYGAYVHRALQCAKTLEREEGVHCDVLDLRSLVPLDLSAICASVKRTGRVLLVGEDSKTGSILQSIASQISEGMFRYLDAPVRVLGALDTPVPYSPPLEDEFLVSNEFLLSAARELLAW